MCEINFLRLSSRLANPFGHQVRTHACKFASTCASVWPRLNQRRINYMLAKTPPVITCYHEVLCLALDSWGYLVHCLQIFHDKDVGGKVYHVLFSTAVRHPEKIVQIVDRRSKNVTCHKQIRTSVRLILQKSAYKYLTSQPLVNTKERLWFQARDILSTLHGTYAKMATAN